MVVTEPLTEFERAELRALRDAFGPMQAAHRLERFHCLDGIKDDSCPCCGAPIEVVDTPHGTGMTVRWRRGWE